MKNYNFAAFARALFVSVVHFISVAVLSTTWNEWLCRYVGDVSTWPQIFNFAFFSVKRWYQINSRILRRHFTSILTSNNWEMNDKLHFQMKFSLKSTSCLFNLPYFNKTTATAVAEQWNDCLNGEIQSWCTCGTHLLLRAKRHYFRRFSDNTRASRG